jgi:hypothetical protein
LFRIVIKRHETASAISFTPSWAAATKNTWHIWTYLWPYRKHECRSSCFMSRSCHVNCGQSQMLVCGHTSKICYNFCCWKNLPCSCNQIISRLM